MHNFPKYGQSNFKVTLVLIIFAVFLLITGAINFSNLSIARAFTRAKEVGVRKVLGSKRIHIILQSLLDVGLQCFIALLAGLLLSSVALVYLSNAFNIPLAFLDKEHIFIISLQVFAGFVFIVLLAGLYPALFLSKYETIEVLKGVMNRGKRGLFFRNCLLVVQLVLSAFFITGSLVVVKQLHFMQTKNLGFNPSQVVRIEAKQATREKKFEATRLKLLEVAGVEYVSKTTAVPGDKVVDTSTNDFKFNGEKYRLNSVRVGNDYFKTLNIPALQGRVFDYAHPEDSVFTAVINEAAAKELGVANPVGMLIRNSGFDSLPYTIVGVVQDFNVEGLQHAVLPAFYTTSNHRTDFRSGGAILVKINTADVQKTIGDITKVWKNVEPDFPIRYSFLDQNFQKLYTDETQLAKIILFFTGISIVIAAMGLFALTAFLAEQRTKEIGIRKVFGASVPDIALLLSKDFTVLIIVALVIATPLAWIAATNWLNGFTYKTHLGWSLFLLADIAAFIVSIATVVFQSLKAAKANPAKSLRTE